MRQLTRPNAEKSHKRLLVSYDTPEVTIQKAAYINQMGLGGAMWWELDADKDEQSGGSLVRIIRDHLGEPEHRENELAYPGSSECLDRWHPTAEYDNLQRGM